MGFKPFFLQREAWVFNSLLNVNHCARGEVYGEIVSYPFLPTLMWFSFFSSIQCVGSAQLILGVLSWKNHSVCYRSVCPGEEVSSGSFYIAHLNWNLSLTFENLIIMCFSAALCGLNLSSLVSQQVKNPPAKQKSMSISLPRSFSHYCL